MQSHGFAISLIEHEKYHPPTSGHDVQQIQFTRHHFDIILQANSRYSLGTYLKIFPHEYDLTATGKMYTRMKARFFKFLSSDTNRECLVSSSFRLNPG